MVFEENALDTESARQYANPIVFTWGAANVVRYVAWTEDLTIDGNLYTAVPSIKIKFGKQHGGSRDAPIRITMPPLSPIDDMVIGEPFAPVSVLVSELKVGDDATLRDLFFGTIRKTISNRGGRSNVVELEIVGIKKLTEVPLGIPANTGCAWIFGDANCKVDVPAVTESGELQSINGQIVTIDRSGWAPANLVDRRFHRGYLELDGLRIMIRDHDTINIYLLAEAPPAAWLGATVTAVPGCDKTLTTCIGQWANERNFAGFGVGIPGYAPQIESP